MRRQLIIKSTTKRCWIAALCSVFFGLLSASFLVGQERSVLVAENQVAQDPALVGPPITVNPEELLPPNQDPEEMELLMRAPLHEAFAEVLETSYEPGPLVLREPPELIEELPPEYKPEGENVLWISGYWYWDEDRDDFIWISGVWRDAPPSQRWVPGYWATEVGGFRWVRGFWIGEEIDELIYLPQPPAPLEVGPSTPAPSEDFFYTPGTWVHRDSRYIWQPGHYAPFIEDIMWVPPTYVWTPSGYIFRPGYWDRPFDCRGTVFAPVAFRRPIFRAASFVLRPRCVIDTGFGLFPHLFVRRGFRHYYFGNYYDARFVGGGFCPWSNIGHFGFHRTQFDPLYSFYGSPFIRYRNTSVIHWAQGQHVFFNQNAHLRPPVVFNLNVVNQRVNNNVIINNINQGGFPQQQVFLADTIDRRARQTSASHLDRQAQRYVRLTQQQQQQEQAAVNRDLARQRRDLERHVRQTRPTQTANATTTPPARIKLPAEVRQAETIAQRTQREAERATQRAQADAKIREKQTEAAARAESRRASTQQQRSDRDIANQARDSQRATERVAQDQQRQDRRTDVQNRTEQQRTQRETNELTRRREVEEKSQEQKSQNAARQQSLEELRNARTTERRDNVQDRNQQRQVETQQRRVDSAAQQQASQQQRAAQEAARRAQTTERRDTIQDRNQQRQVETQQRRVDSAAQQQAAHQQRAAEAAARQQQNAARDQQRQAQIQQRSTDAARQQAARQQAASQQASQQQAAQQRAAQQQASQLQAAQQRAAQQQVSQQRAAQQKAAQQQASQQRAAQQQAAQQQAAQQRAAQRQASEQQRMNRQTERQDRNQGGGGGRKK